MSLDAGVVTGTGGTRTGSLGGAGAGSGIGASRILASARGIRPGTSDVGAPLSALIASVRASGRSTEIWLDGGDYTQTTPIVDTGSTSSSPTVVLRGISKSGTRINASGALLAAGDQLTLNKSYNFEMHGLTWGATSTRSAGCRAIVVNGAIAAPVQRTLQNVLWTNVSLEKQFDGVLFQDSAGAGIFGGVGVIGFEWYGGYLTGFAAGGNGIDIASQNMEMARIEALSHTEVSGIAANLRPNSTMRIRAVADVRCRGIESVWTQTGLLITPGAFMSAGPSWFVNTSWFDHCIWAGSSQAVLIDCTSFTAGLLTFTSNYVDGSDLLTGNGIHAKGGGANLKALVCTGLQGQTVQTMIRLENSTGTANFGDTSVAGNVAIGFHALTNSANFNFDGVFGAFQGGTLVGARVAAGCNHYALKLVGALVNCTTPLDEPTPGANRSVINV